VPLVYSTYNDPFLEHEQISYYQVPVI
jgi:hypothetical protein